MNKQKYSVNHLLIEALLTFFKSGEIAIPEIQRPFVWDASQVRDLLDSLYQGYPIGYLIVWKNPDVRLKDGSVSEGKKVLIDGQQRITALAAALLGYEVINKDYKKVRIRIAFNPVKERFDVTNSAIEKDKEWIPDIAPFMQGDIGLVKFIRGYTEVNPSVSEEALEEVLTRLKGIDKKQVGVIELAADLDIEVVTEIFIRINREGVKLSPADFAMSKIASNETYGGNVLRKAIDYFCHLAVKPEFCAHIEKNDPDFVKTDYFQRMSWLRDENDDLYDPSYNDLLRVAFVSKFAKGKIAHLVSLLSGRNFETRSFEEGIAAQSFERLKEGVMEFMKKTNFEKFLMILQSAGFTSSALLKNKQGTLNFAYALYLKLRDDGVNKGEVEHYVRRWFVLTLLTSRYSGQTETKFEQDIRRIDDGDFGDFLDSIEKAELSDTFWEVGLVQDMNTSNSNHSAFRCFLASQVKNNVRGFLSKDITVRDMLEHHGDVHHIFPRHYLKTEMKLKRSEYNQIANYAYTQQEINIAIGKKSPETYISELCRQCENGKSVYGNIVDMQDLKRNFEENAVPESFLNGDLNHYKDFLDQRRQLIATKLKEYYFSL